MVIKIIATVRDSYSSTIKTGRIQSVELIPFIGKQVELTVKVVK